MKLARLTSIALAAAAIAMPSMAQAQQVLQFDGVTYTGGDLVGSSRTGVYQAHVVPGGTPFDIYCIDYDHTAGNSWKSRSITFGDAVGAYSAATTAQLGSGVTLQKLRAAAWLSTQFGPVGPGANDDNFDDVHGAIWSLFSTNVPVTGAMTTLATQAVTNHGNDVTLDAQYVLVYDFNAFTVGYDATKLNQAFITADGNTEITVTPEPSTYVLMGAGLLAVGFVRRRRRNVA